MRLSFHNHTNYSHDCWTTLKQLEARCIEKGIDAITITDHHTARGALKAAQELTRVQVIVGQEIETIQGEVIGLFLQKEVASGKGVQETLDEIHAQGGVAVVPHPFDRLRRHVLETEALRTHLADIDMVEIFNARAVFRQDNTLAAQFARENHKLAIVGNDAHTISELGSTYVEMSDFTDSTSFLRSLQNATFHTEYSPLWVHVTTKLVKWHYKLFGRGSRHA